MRCFGCFNFVKVEEEAEQSIKGDEPPNETQSTETQPSTIAENAEEIAKMTDDRNDDLDGLEGDLSENDDDLRELDEALKEAEADRAIEESGFDLGAPIDKKVRAENAQVVDPFANGESAPPRMLSESQEMDLVTSHSVQPLVRWKEEPDDFDEDYDAINFRGDKSDREAEMDMTPMVDVTFLLLIFFMVTASFTLQKSIEQPPQTEDEPSLEVTVEEEDEPDYILVFVDEYNTFQVIYGEHDWECPSGQELIRRLREVMNDTAAGATPTELLVMAHGDCLHERVVMAMDAGTEVGMASIQVTMTETGP